MLRSFQYQETAYTGFDTTVDSFRQKEIDIAKGYVSDHASKRGEKETCPICGNNSGKIFYTKWNVKYNRCKVCKSIYAVCDAKEVEEYHSNEELLKLRCSKEYQKKATDERIDTWNDFIEWVQVRAYRFMKRNKDLSIVDIGNRFEGYVDAISNSDLAKEYELKDSVIEYKNNCNVDKADIVFYLDQMQKEINPKGILTDIKNTLKDDGLLILNTRAGSGFDIITLKEDNEKIYPYEHVLLPSFKGLITLLENAGYEVLEITTPGVLDVKYVMQSLDVLDGREEFVKYLLEESDNIILQEFQRFLQKGGLSSFVCVIARKKKN